MEIGPRAFCVSLGSRGVSEARTLVRGLPGEVRYVELRADLLPASDLADTAWETLPGTGNREWVFTWRSPEEGGRGGARPAGLLARARTAGFPWIDVEGARLAAEDREALEVPVEQRWVSAHRERQPRDAGELRKAWEHLQEHPGALHKLVVPAERFEVNGFCLDLLHELRGTRPGAVTLFAMGQVGHPSRMLGALAGNAVTYVAPAPDEGTAPGQPDLAEVTGLYRLAQQPEDAPVFGVLGFGIRQSRSPRLHNRAFQRSGVAGIYLRLESPEPGPVVDWLRGGRVRGLSVTSPHKLGAAALADVRDDAVEETGAANTLWMEGSVLRAGNTDVHAAEVLLRELDLQAGGPVAVLGAGGASAAVIAAARSLGGEVTLFNRGETRGRGLAEAMKVRWGGTLDALHPGRFAVVANATPLGREGSLPSFLETRDWGSVSILDLAYGPRPTAWERLAARERLAFRGGLLFLAVQGAEQFRIWTGHRIGADSFAEGLDP